MESNHLDQHLVDRLRQLQAKRRHILKLPPEEALEHILDDPQATALVHSLPETDFYFLLQDIGPEDSLPLLQLASDRQWDHLIDLETWQKDRFDLPAASRWLALLMEADPQRFLRWALEERLDFLELYLFRNLEVRIREHDQDPSEFGEEFFSLDNTYFIRVLDLPPLPEAAGISDAQRRDFLLRFIHRLAEHDHRTYQAVMLEAAHVIPAETEEEALHWRGVRLAEKGFLPFDEAVGVYQPMSADALLQKEPKQQPSAGEAAELTPVPAYPFRVMAADDRFTGALQQIDAEDRLHHLQLEFANLCNRIVVADRQTVRDRDALRDVVRKACGYLSIGLEQLSPGERAADPRRAARQLTRHALIDIFRVGFGRALALKWRAEKWLSSCWFAAAGLRLSFWGEQWMGVLGGLLVKKPLFFDNYQAGKLYREFRTTAEIEATEEALEQIQSMDELLSLMSLDLERPLRRGFLTYKNLLLTLWARHHLGFAGAAALSPLKVEDFLPFFRELLPGDQAPEADATRTVPGPIKRSFVEWLSGRTGLKADEIGARLGAVFTLLFAEIEAELGRVPADRLDPRFVNLFLLDSPS